MYELAFVRRCVAAGQRDVLADLRFTARFLDDLFSAQSLMFAQRRYDIYPRQFLTLDPSEPAPARSVSFLDLEVSQDPFLGLTHRLFDKRREPAYRSIPIVRLPHRLSVMPDVVQSQIIRFRCLCMTPDDFVMELARLLAILHHNKGYSLHRLLMLTRRSLRRFPSLYGARSYVGIFLRVRGQLFRMLDAGTFLHSCV